MDYSQMSLGVAASVLHRVQKLGIGPSEAGQLLGIELVGLTPLAIDQPSLTRVSDQYLVTTLLQQTAYPGRVGSDLDGDMQRPFRIEPAPHRLWGGAAQPAPLDELAAFGVDETEVAVLVSQIHTRRHLHLLGATITHGPILLSGPLKEPVDYLQTLRQGTARRIGLLISSKVEQGEVRRIILPRPPLNGPFPDAPGLAGWHDK